MNFHLARKLSFNLTDVIHVGAHKFEESHEYNLYGTTQVIWIDPLPQADPETLPKNQQFIQIAIDNVKVPSQRDFKIFSATGFSSFYNLVQPKSILRGTPPQETTITVPTDSLANVVSNHNLKMFKSLVIDTQGSEFDILESAILEQFEEIIVETSRQQLYENEKSHKAINKLLIDSGFELMLNDSDYIFGHGDQYFSRSGRRNRLYEFVQRACRTFDFILSLASRIRTAVLLRLNRFNPLK